MKWKSLNFYTPQIKSDEINSEIVRLPHSYNKRWSPSIEVLRKGFLPSVGCWFDFQIVNSLLINLYISLRYPTPKFYVLMGPLFSCIVSTTFVAFFLQYLREKVGTHAETNVVATNFVAFYLQCCCRYLPYLDRCCNIFTTIKPLII